MRSKKLWIAGAVTVLVVGWTAWTQVLDRGAIAPTEPSAEVRWAPPVPGLRLHVFQTGRMALDAWMVAPYAPGKRVMDQPAYLVEHPVHGRLMFEAGHHSNIARDPGEHLGWIHAAGLMPMEQDLGQDARTQLQAAGIDPDSVALLVPSHFHPEHVGAVEEFPQAEVIVDARELDHGLRSPDYNYVPREYDGVKRWRRVTFAGQAPFGPFADSLDVFGDGSVRIVSTPGHTPGHVSLAVNLPEGPVLLAGDAAWSELNLEYRSIGLPFVSNDGPAARRSLGQLLRFVEENPGVLVVPGHDLAPLRRATRSDVTLHPWPAGETLVAK